MNIKEKYELLEKIAKDEYLAKIDSIKQELREEQKKCNHKLEIRGGVFYALGETAPGAICYKCGYQRHLTQKEHIEYEEKR